MKNNVLQNLKEVSKNNDYDYDYDYDSDNDIYQSYNPVLGWTDRFREEDEKEDSSSPEREMPRKFGENAGKKVNELLDIIHLLSHRAISLFYLSLIKLPKHLPAS